MKFNKVSKKQEKMLCNCYNIIIDEPNRCHQMQHCSSKAVIRYSLLVMPLTYYQHLHSLRSTY